MESLNLEQLRDFFLAGIEKLNKYQGELDSLNVFPIPDQDTGTNLVLTLEGTRTKLAQLKTLTPKKFAKILSQTSLINAKGNSGIILSQFLAGFSSKIGGRHLLLPNLVEAFRKGRDYAYSAIANPTEGTVLTVINHATTSLEEEAQSGVLRALETCTKKAYQALTKTPTLLPILKQVGVVDSAAAGFVLLLEGGVAKLNGRASMLSPKIERLLQTKPKAKRLTTIKPGAGYCLSIKLKSSLLPLHRIRAILEEKGDSLIVGGSKKLSAIHIHTKVPEEIKKVVQNFGQVARFEKVPLNKVKNEPTPLIDLGRYYEKG